MDVFDIKDIISKFHEACKDSITKRKLEEKIIFILYHYGVIAEQRGVLAQSILNILYTNEDSNLIKVNIKNELKIVEDISVETINSICQYIFDNILLYIKPEIWMQYYSEKQEKGRKEVKTYLKEHLDLIEQDIRKIIDIITPKLFKLDEYEAKIANEWGDESFHINLDFFDFGNVTFKDELNKAFSRGDKLIYIKGPTREQALYAVLLELKYSDCHDHVFVGQSNEFFERSELFNISTNIYVVDYDTSIQNIPNGRNGTFIIPISKDIYVSESHKSYVIEINTWDAWSFDRNLRNAGYKDGNSYLEKYGESWDVFKKMFYHGKSYKQDFINKNRDCLNVIKKMILVGGFKYRKRTEAYTTDVDYLKDYLALNDRDEIIVFIKEYTKEENKILEATWNVYCNSYDSIRVVKNNNYDEVFDVLTQSDVNGFLKFSKQILDAYKTKMSNDSRLGNYKDSPSAEMLSKIISTWMNLKFKWSSESVSFVKSAISILDYSAIASNSFSFALISPALIGNYIIEFLKNVREKEVSQLRFFWFKVDRALKYLVNYIDSEKIIYILWDDVRPAFKGKGQDGLVTDFVIDQLNPWYRETLFPKDRFIKFAEHMDDESLFYVLSSYIAYQTNWRVQDVECIDSSLTEIRGYRIKIDSFERAEIINYCFDRIFQVGSIDPKKIVEILSNTYALNYSYSFDKIKELFQNFNSFNDIDKVSIELTLRRKAWDFKKCNALKDVTKWIEDFVRNIKYKNRCAKYLWLFSSSDNNPVPFFDDNVEQGLIENCSIKYKSIMLHIDDGFDRGIILELLNSFEIKDMDNFIRISLNYFASSYDSGFYKLLASKTPNAYIYIDALLDCNNNAEDFISILLEDLFSDKYSENFPYNYAAALTYLPLKIALEYVDTCKNMKARKRFYEICRCGNRKNGKLSYEELKLLVEDMIMHDDIEDATFLLDYNWECFSLEDNMHYLEAIYRSMNRPVKSQYYFDEKLFHMIKEKIRGDNGKIKLYKDIEYFFRKDLFYSDDSIFLSYFYSNPIFVVNLIKAATRFTGYENYSYDDIDFILSSIKKFNPPDYIIFISNFIETLKEDEIAYDRGLRFLAALILKAPQARSCLYVPCDEISDVLELKNDLLKYFEQEIFNEGSSHSADGGIFLEKKANTLLKEAESIKSRYPKIAAALYGAAQSYKSYARDERTRERYE